MRVLIVDDSEPIRRLLRRTIEKRPTFTIVGEACNGVDAIEAVDRLHPDVIILDINMPVMDGVEAARLIKRACPTVGIIVYSSSPSSRLADLLDDQVILGHVDKAATDDLVRRLDELVRGSQKGSVNNVVSLEQEEVVSPE
jgi:chemotaxis response regulator CheB